MMKVVGMDTNLFSFFSYLYSIKFKFIVKEFMIVKPKQIKEICQNKMESFFNFSLCIVCKISMKINSNKNNNKIIPTLNLKIMLLKD